MKTILVIGATSAIAQETARCFAVRGAELFLVARTPEKLEAVAADLQGRGAARVGTAVLDITQTDRHVAILEEAAQFLGSFDAVLVAHGMLPDQRACEKDPSLALQAIVVNASSVIAILTRLANIFETQRHGTIAVITSVAGDRGRQSNYVYGTAKAAVNVFMEGLRNRLFPAGVRVMTIKPGFVDTPMTAHIPKNPLFASARTIGRGIFHAMTHGKQDVTYLPWRWHIISLIIRSIPEPIFKRLKL